VFLPVIAQEVINNLHLHGVRRHKNLNRSEEIKSLLKIGISQKIFLKTLDTREGISYNKIIISYKRRYAT